MSDSGVDPMVLQENYRQLKKKLESVSSELKSNADKKLIRDKLIQLQQEMKNLRFNYQDREELWSSVQEVFDKLQQAYETEKIQFENEAYQNYTKLRTIVENAIFLCHKAADTREAKAVLIEAQQEFKGLRLIKEQREELYQQLQKEFDRVNALLDQEKGKFQLEAEENYRSLKELVNEAVEKVKSSADTSSAREFLISTQNEFKGKSLLKEHRDLLYQQLQDAFTIVNSRITKEKELLRLDAESQFSDLHHSAKELLTNSGITEDFRSAREELKRLQATLKDSILFREQKDTIYNCLQEVFLTLNRRQDIERSQFEQDAAKNYTELGKMVAEGLHQAQESSEYKETREFLKKIQAEFKGRKMIKEQREELYSRLQSAFDILSKRIDTFFREKKKNWAVRMQFKLNELQTTIGEYEKRIERDSETLQELETQLDIISDSGREVDARERITAKILSVENSIRHTHEMIREAEEEAESIRQKLAEPEEN